MENSPISKPAITSDLIAGLAGYIPSIPDAMASDALAGINQINFC
jgi:hypothetical protein